MNQVPSATFNWHIVTAPLRRLPMIARVMPPPSANSGAASRLPAVIRCKATLLRPAAARASWTFLNLPAAASAALPSRGMVSVDGTINGKKFLATLRPDGKGGHWMKVDKKLREAARAAPGDTVALEMTPASREPEPRVPANLRKALAAAPAKVREAWADITPAARRDFIHWIESAKQAHTRERRAATACDMLAKGKRRPCCFDRSGMYSGSQCCPEAE